MFYNCTSLVSTPELSSTSLAGSCYQNMFSGCELLTSIPELPATTLYNNCYNEMFSGCTSLEDLSYVELPATTLAQYCYWAMFSGCTSLEHAPQLPATTLANYCYGHMFQNCTSLTHIPALPATTLNTECYGHMFDGCTSLTEAYLPATSLPSTQGSSGYCYSNMFRNCESLNTIKINYTGSFNNNFNEWVDGVAEEGTLYYKGSDSTVGISAIPTGWNVSTFFGLKFTAPENATIHISYSIEGTLNNKQLFYSDDDGITWTSWGVNDNPIIISTLNNSYPKYIYVKGNNPNGLSESPSNYIHFDMYRTGGGGGVSPNPYYGPYVSGNINSLLDNGDGSSLSNNEIPNNYCFYRLFYNYYDENTNVKIMNPILSIPELPATTLKTGCYKEMFLGCNLLIDLCNVRLPATTLASACYYGMFKDCSILDHAPILPATTLADECYSYMFSGCSYLGNAPKLHTTTVSQYSYSYMFQNCTSLTEAPKLPATTLASHCYICMFEGCTSLTKVYDLPATTLTDSCYGYMFSKCTSLIKAPRLQATTLAEGCYSGMFSGCTSLIESPELPATTLSPNCYDFMFADCSSLNVISISYLGNLDPNDTHLWSPPDHYFYKWVGKTDGTDNFGVPDHGYFYYSGNDTTVGINAIPYGWEVINTHVVVQCPNPLGATVHVLHNGTEYTGTNSRSVAISRGDSIEYWATAEDYYDGAHTVETNILSNATYTISALTQYPQLLIDYTGTPSDPTITINNIETNSLRLASNTPYSYEVSKSGYITKSGTGTMASSNVTIPVTDLDVLIPCTLTINAQPSGANPVVTINGVNQTSITVPQGTTIRYSVNAGNNYNNITNATKVVNSTETMTVTLSLKNVNLTATSDNSNGVSIIYESIVPTTQNAYIKLKGENVSCLGIGNGSYSGSVLCKGGTAEITCQLTANDSLKIKSIPGYVLSNSNTSYYPYYAGKFGGCGLGLYLNNECVLVVGGAGYFYSNYGGCGGGGYRGGVGWEQIGSGSPTHYYGYNYDGGIPSTDTDANKVNGRLAADKDKAIGDGVSLATAGHALCGWGGSGYKSPSGIFSNATLINGVDRTAAQNENNLATAIINFGV